MSTAICVPAYALISDITRGQQTVITLEAAHSFSIGEIVSFRVSKPYGMVQLNNRQGLVRSIGDLSITVEIDSLGFDPFVNAGESVTFPAMVVPSASGIIPNSNPSTVTLADAFDRIRSN